jgi:preprotein translocase subunit SecD
MRSRWWGVFLFLALAAPLTLWVLGIPVFSSFLGPWLGIRPQQQVLTYEIDPASVPSVQEIDPWRMVEAIRARLTAVRCRVDVLPTDGYFQVMIHSGDAGVARRADRLLRAVGTLEFRILANRRDDKDLIERAKGEPSKTQVLDSRGRLRAWWVRVDPAAAIYLRTDSDLGVRARQQAGHEFFEVLLVADPYSVTGEYIADARAGTDQSGRACVLLAFNKMGAQLFGELTGSHLPDSATHSKYRLGVIFDGMLYSAPSINSTIYDRAEITGSFTPQEVQDITDLLNSGSLPARLRLVASKPQ